MDTYAFRALGQRPNEQLQRFAALLQSENEKHNLTRITETDQIYVRHFADSLQLTGVLDATVAQANSEESGFRLIDLGSGAGLPGLALAMARPAWDVLSVEATGKKVRFQQQVKESAGLTNARTIQARAEDLAHESAYQGQFDLVTARAVGHLRILTELGLPFAKIGGLLAFFKGPKIDQELQEAQATIQFLGAKAVKVHHYHLSEIAQDLEPVPDTLNGTMSLVVMEKISPTPPAFPRSFSQIKQKPIQSDDMLVDY
jgi:16S rRNA (guanine527-N7)-methyltransferase